MCEHSILSPHGISLLFNVISRVPLFLRRRVIFIKCAHSWRGRCVHRTWHTKIHILIHILILSYYVLSWNTQYTLKEWRLHSINDVTEKRLLLIPFLLCEYDFSKFTCINCVYQYEYIGICSVNVLREVAYIIIIMCIIKYYFIAQVYR